MIRLERIVEIAVGGPSIVNMTFDGGAKFAIGLDGHVMQAHLARVDDPPVVGDVGVFVGNDLIGFDTAPGSEWVSIMVTPGDCGTAAMVSVTAVPGFTKSRPPSIVEAVAASGILAMRGVDPAEA